MACITGVALWRLHSAYLMTDFLVSDKLAKQQLASDWLGAAKLNGVRAISIAKSDSLEVADFFQSQLAEGDKVADAIEKKLLTKPGDERETAMLRSVAEKEQAYLNVRKQVFTFKDQGRTMEVEQLANTTLKTTFATYTTALEELLSYQTREAQAMAEDSASEYRSSRATLIAFGVLALALGGVFAWFITRSVVVPLNHAVELATRVSEGDLRAVHREKRDDESASCSMH
ncbi:MCP four helix bundle domain-containing protein [Pseudoduganella sp. UC29_106]|uniref:MCP four helix bundle domain-containing protein n=1 Tax=Pseudoduganella sp. UC29_106 TaxID=3374553 RepID=UPI0037565247